MDDFFEDFLLRYRNDCSYDSNGNLRSEALVSAAIGTDLILQSLSQYDHVSVPRFASNQTKHVEFAEWVLGLPSGVRVELDLHQDRPPRGIHWVSGVTDIFYDFKNTDIMLEEFDKIQVQVHGNFLDFGCSSGRNVATLERIFGNKLSLHGVDPVGASIKWAQQNFPSADLRVNEQEPPLNHPDDYFDFVMAKSIWTHFSASAAKNWFLEIARILKKGGHFFFSTHGPHDIASRLIYNNPNPKYYRYAGHETWTKEAFLREAIRGLDDRGFFFQCFKNTDHQGDLSQIEDADGEDWGLAFMLPNYLQNELLPHNLRIVSRSVGRTGNRHDVYIVRKV